MSTINSQNSVGQLVLEQPGRARVFEELGIDYCCGGKRTLADACQKKGLNAANVAEALAACDRQQDPSEQNEPDYARMSLTGLCDHIEQTHHAYLKSELPRLEGLIERVVKRHGDGDPRLSQVLAVYQSFAQEMLTHAAKEERILFPYIRAIEAAGGATASHCGSVQNPIRQMMAEHDAAGAALEKMHELTDGFQPPSHACNTYRAALKGLADVEHDTHRHVHKENNSLFPRAVELESRGSGGCGCGGDA